MEIKNKIIIFLVLGIVLKVIIYPVLLDIYPEKTKKNTLFVQSRDFAVTTLNYLILVMGLDIATEASDFRFLILIAVINIIIIISNIKWHIQIMKLLGGNKINTQSRKQMFIFINSFYSVVIAFSALNCLAYFINKDFFIGVMDGNCFTIAFDFMYYSLMVGITSGTTNIEPNSILTKIIAVIQLFVFIYIIGESIILITNKTESDV